MQRAENVGHYESGLPLANISSVWLVFIGTDAVESNGALYGTLNTSLNYIKSFVVLFGQMYKVARCSVPVRQEGGRQFHVMYSFEKKWSQDDVIATVVLRTHSGDVYVVRWRIMVFPG